MGFHQARNTLGALNSASRVWTSVDAFLKNNKALAAIVFLSIFPLLMPYEALAVKILVFGLYALGFNLLFGYTGMLSFGHAALLGAGAYGAGMAIVHLKAPFLLAIAGGVALAAVVAIVMGQLSIRTRGIYFSMVTLALSQCVYYLIYQAESWTGGENGLRGINISTVSFLGIQINFLDPLLRYYVIFAFVALALWFLARIFGVALWSGPRSHSREREAGYRLRL